ncbi:glycosyltransferase family 4 protein [Paenibacillus protaetiae]|uniref:Glycosyltransferase n=1 Tax=Paenibacillus protaetiae TaxID=2509456 RepID=A0A4P6EW10_9BACL|nr:glycosyltransferase family 4 protein [Paenibacillus protaetiae]QAY66765.1 glycosyltransferase [Paenibacillus protaetiae]
MKVLFTTNIPSPYRVDFFNELGKKCELTVLFESNEDKSRDKKWYSDEFTNFKGIFMKGIKVGDADALSLQVIKYLSLKKYDLIVIGAYHTPSGMLAIQYMKLRNIPFLLNIDGGIKQEESKIKHKIKQYFISSAEGWLSTGKLTNDYLKYYGACSEKIYVYPFTSIKESNVLKKPVSIEEKTEIRKKLGIKEEKMVLSVGQFIYRKGYDVLLNASKDFEKNVGVYIVGGKPTSEYIQMRTDMKLTNVYFIDFLNKLELSDYYKAADVFVLPTREDIWGLVVNEALAYGLPVITTNRCVAGTELIKELVGEIIEVNDVQGLSKGIIKVLSDENYTDSSKCIEIANKYTIEKMAESHYKIFESYRINY